MKILVRLAFLMLLFLGEGCSTAGPEVFKKKSLHELYAKKISELGLDKTAMGMQWLTEAEKALQSPQSISLPYKEMGYFSADQPRAVGLQFKATRGEKLFIDIEQNPKAQFALFAELWQMEEEGKSSMLVSFDTAQLRHEYEVDETGGYLVRLQPELLRSCDYTLTISVGPSLHFPVGGKLGKIGSIWGDERDAGARKHEGIDLFAPKRTPVVAATDGVITKVNENNLGGKVIWQRPKGKNMSLYYAHLDEQLVTDGQKVKAGDTIAFVGNTGNARTTPPHLHFGIYTFGGAIDPLPFVNPVIRKPGALISYAKDFHKALRITSDFRVSEGGKDKVLENNILMWGLAVNSSNVRGMLPDSTLISVPFQKIEKLTPIEAQKVRDSSYVYERPQDGGVRKMKLKVGAMVSILGYFKGHIYIKTEAGIYGWIPASVL